MRVLIQRVEDACVTVESETVSSIKSGLLLFLGITPDDTDDDVDYLAKKIAGLRVFEDENGRMNLSIQDVGGEALVISQFTLYADMRRGRRPSFSLAARPEQARPLYREFCRRLKSLGVPVKKGRFGAHMYVELTNDGPVTLWLDTKELRT